MGERGPKLTTINWEEFEKLVSYQCTQIEIADFFGITVDTLDNCCRRDLGLKLSEVWDKKKSLGRVKLKKIQFDLAEQGSAIMAIYLGKHLLGQTDTPIDKELLEVIQNVGMTRDELLELVRTGAKANAVQAKKSFSEFMVTAGYPAPFPKQIEMHEFGMHETDPRLLLGARGYGKTDYVVIGGIAYELYLNPLESTNLILTKSKERNAAIVNEIKNACEKNGVVFEKANATSLRVAGLHGKDHSVSAVTIKTVSLRGRHPKRVILDDPVTEDDTSEATRLLVEKKWNEVNKLVSNVLIIGQPAHKFDLYAKLRPLLKKLEVPYGSIPELDHDLEAQRLAGVDEASIQASYFLTIISEGTTPFDNIKYLDKYPVGDSVAFIDPANEGTDFTSITILRAHFDGVAVVGFAWRKAWNHCLDDIAPQLVKYGVRKLAFETNKSGEQPIPLLRQAFANIGVVGRFTTTDKHSRIMSAGAFAHLIHLSKESSTTYTNQVVQYEYGAKHDDAPDSLATCLEWIGLIRGK